MVMGGYLTLNTGVELLCLGSAVYNLRRDPHPVWRRLPWYFLVVCLVEFSGIFLRHQKLNNNWVYNLYFLFETGFLSAIFQTILDHYSERRRLVLAGLFVTSWVFVYDLIAGGLTKHAYFSGVVFGILMILYSLYYFLLVLRADEPLNLWRAADFWFVFGAFFYYFGATFHAIFFPALKHLLTLPPKPPDTFTIMYKTLYSALNVVQYLCFSLAVLIRNKWNSAATN